MTIDDTAIPHIDTALEPFAGADELRQRWRALMGPLGFSESLLWFSVIDADNRFGPPLHQVELPDLPDDVLSDLLMSNLGRTLGEIRELSVAILLTRPGRDGVTADDMTWAQMLTRDARRHGVRLHPIHRANDSELVALTIADAAA